MTDEIAPPDDIVQDQTTTTRRLEEEGEIAADYLEELLDIADVDGDIDIDVDHGRAAVEIVAEAGSERGLRRLVGADGSVLDALQELTRLAVQTKTGERSRLMLDIAGFRAGRRAELAEVARAAIAEVRSSGESVSLAPMNPFERKVVHDVVAEAGLVSDSDGVEPSRHVVIHPA
jgi:spoIIIJ-associated protein